ncbi:hypothetical protein NDU88_007880 [Pleurodeles waltl]|uniref:DUF5523 domain-containing protein n=1 Tax=Pleurodeles waltl TaxID=8319 RepID=A0AAV7QLW9_PLEWA|nr:hypothetical protein NDU88_007880 [Pleurodeles waltl]
MMPIRNFAKICEMNAITKANNGRNIIGYMTGATNSNAFLFCFFNPKEEDYGYSFFVSDGDECFPESQASQPIAFKQLDKELLHEALRICADMKDPVTSSDSAEEVTLPCLLDIKPAEYKCNNLMYRDRETLIFVPSSDPVSYRFKLQKDLKARNIEDEGLYVRRGPKFYRKCINKMERRLLQESEDKHWFGISGEIISLPSPIKETWTVWKNDPTSSLHPALETVYIKLQIGELNKLRDIVKLYVKWLNGENCGNKQQPSCLTTRKPAVDPWGFKYKLPQTSYIN